MALFPEGVPFLPAVFASAEAQQQRIRLTSDQAAALLACMFCGNFPDSATPQHDAPFMTMYSLMTHTSPQEVREGRSKPPTPKPFPSTALS